MVPNAHLLEELVHVCSLWWEPMGAPWCVTGDCGKYQASWHESTHLHRPVCVSGSGATCIYLSYFMFIQIILASFDQFCQLVCHEPHPRHMVTWPHLRTSQTSQDSHRVSLCVSRCVMLCLPLSEPGLTQREVISWRRDKGLGTRPKSKPCPEAKCNASTLHIFHILHKHPKP